MANKDKVEISGAVMSKIAKGMRGEAERLNETADALDLLASSRAETSQLKSTNDSIKREIMRNTGQLEAEQKKVKGIYTRVQDAELKAEGEISEIEEGVKNVKTEARAKIKTVQVESDNKLIEIQNEAEDRVSNAKAVITEANEAEAKAVNDKDKAEGELQAFKDKVIGGVS